MYQTAVKAFERGCALDHGRACASLGQVVKRAIHTEYDAVRAAVIFEKACKLGEASGCSDAANLYETGREARSQTLNLPSAPPIAKRDLPRDPARAVALYQRACDLGASDFCFVTARILEAGEGVPADREKALGLFARLCEGGMALACTRAAALAPSGQEQGYVRRACVFGGQDQCAPPGK